MNNLQEFKRSYIFRLRMKMKTILIKTFLLGFTLFGSNLVYAEMNQKNTGMLFGANHAFYFTAPKAWVLDNRSGVNQGLHMVFYPEGESWNSSPVIAYGRSCTKDEQLKSVYDQVKITVEQFHKQGSPSYKAEKKSSIYLPDNTEIEIYLFEGDKWGNYEAAGYIEEEDTINFLVFNARTKKVFDKYLPAFTELLRTYGNSYSKSIEDSAFDKLVEKAKEFSNRPDGKDYETSVVKGLGASMANFMRDCASYLTEEKLNDFEVILKIEPSGNITDAFARPHNALSTCFKGLISETKCLPHQFDSFVFHIEMKIK